MTVTEESAHEFLIITVHQAPMPTAIEMQLFKRAIDAPPEISQCVFALTQSICELKLPEHLLFMCRADDPWAVLLDLFDVPGVLSCRLAEPTDPQYRLIPFKVKM